MDVLFLVNLLSNEGHIAQKSVNFLMQNALFCGGPLPLYIHISDALKTFGKNIKIIVYSYLK